MPLPVLSASERLEAAQHVFLILDRVEKGKLKNRKFGPEYFFHRRETALSVNLKVNWRKTYTAALKEVFKVIPESLTREAMDLLERELLSTLGPAFGASPAVRRQMKEYIREAYTAAKKGWSLDAPKNKKSQLLTLQDHRAIEALTRHNCFWLGEHYGEHVGPKISDLTRQALKDGLGRKALAEMLEESFSGKNDDTYTGYQYWDVASSAALVRARSFGTIAGMEDAGVTEYEVLAMGDERMCPICREMHGRTFSVAEARAVIDTVLEEDDPVKFKDAMPWMTAPPVGKSGSELARSGQSMPPFHGRCRCTLVVISRTTAKVTRESFPKMDSKNVKGFDEDTRIARIQSKGRLPMNGLPNWKYDYIGTDGTVLKRRFFDDNGDPALDVDLSDHNKPKSHPYVPHSHDWVKKVRGKMRKPRKWENEMGEELRKRVVKDSAGEEFVLLTDTFRIGTVEDFIRDLETGNELEFEYDGHSYTVVSDPVEAWEWKKEETYKEFASVAEMMDVFKVHTGESLREIATKITVILSNGPND